MTASFYFLMGRCCEDSKNDANAVSVVPKGHRAQCTAANRSIPATLRPCFVASSTNQRMLIEVIEEMVKSAPENYLVYLERGRYRRQFGLAGSGGRLSEGAGAGRELA